ncbi:hypothetical protein TPENAI_50260 [Tenacibaculum litopenaei]
MEFVLKIVFGAVPSLIVLGIRCMQPKAFVVMCMVTSSLNLQKYGGSKLKSYMAVSLLS